MRILVDVDGVLADLVGALCARIGAFTPEDFTSYEFADVLPERSLVQARGAMTDLGFVLDLPEYPGARAFVNQLKGRGEVVAVTKTFEKASTWAHERTRWLWNRGLDRVVHTSEKHLIMGDVLIEDSAHNIPGWLASNPAGRAILMDRPWNRDAFHSAKAGLIHDYVQGRVKRAVSFDHALALLGE